jgi:hypothetical protein
MPKHLEGITGNHQLDAYDMSMRGESAFTFTNRWDSRAIFTVAVDEPENRVAITGTLPTPTHHVLDAIEYVSGKLRDAGLEVVCDYTILPEPRPAELTTLRSGINYL